MEVMLERRNHLEMKPDPILGAIETPIVSNCKWNIDLTTLKLWNYNDFIKEKLAEGFYGVVSKVTHVETKEVMVLKELRKTSINGEKNRRMFEDEIRLISKLHHPNLLKFEGITMHNKNLCLLSEYIDGGSLECNLADKCPSLSSWNVCLEIALDVARGVTYLHSNGIIHRDLTSRNILLKHRNPGFQAIVADLGLCCFMPEVSLDSQSGKGYIEDNVGSPFHMAPEVLSSKPYDQKADVFSFGIILCEVMSGCPGGDPDDVPRTGDFGLAVEEFSNRVLHCPVEFLNVSVQCCQLDPQNRPSFVDLVKALDIILDIWHEQEDKRSCSTPDNVVANDCPIEDSTTCSCDDLDFGESTIVADLEIKESHDRHGIMQRTGSRRQLRKLIARCPKCGGRRLSFAPSLNNFDSNPTRSVLSGKCFVPLSTETANATVNTPSDELSGVDACCGDDAPIFTASSLLKQNRDEMNETTSTLAQNTPGRLPRFFQYVIRMRRNKYKLKAQLKSPRKRGTSVEGIQSTTDDRVLIGSKGNSVVLRRQVNRALSEPPDVDLARLSLQNRRHSMPLRVERPRRSETAQRKVSDNSPEHKSSERKQRSRSFFNVFTAKMRTNKK